MQLNELLKICKSNGYDHCTEGELLYIQPKVNSNKNRPVTIKIVGNQVALLSPLSNMAQQESAVVQAVELFINANSKPTGFIDKHRVAFTMLFGALSCVLFLFATYQ